MPESDYLNREQALEILGIKAATLYSYVSRGFIRAIPQPGGRASFYLREDVEKAKARAEARAGHGPVAASAMRWGEPVIQTGITEITPQGPRYRARLATDLAREGVSFEGVAEYLWSGLYHDDIGLSTMVRWPSPPLQEAVSVWIQQAAQLHDNAHILQLMSVVTNGLGIAEGSRSERIASGATAVQSARRLIRALAGTFGFLGGKRSFYALKEGESIVTGVLAALGRADDETTNRALQQALVLCADHELNPTTFAARVAASTGADLHSCVGAALGAHFGSLVGAMPDKVEEMFAMPVDEKAILSTIKRLTEAARNPPGFNHPAYPKGDPRTALLLDVAEQSASPRTAPEVHHIRAVLDAAQDQFGALPAIEMGLVTVSRALDLPAGTASGLFALGRSAGWVAHVLEQRLAGFLIRPRAKFV
ncbi:MAG TPA: citrate/2-methylcitrate synthase [Burkholderiales bacterium]